MTFDYLQRVVVEGQLTVDDIGQCVILGRNDLGEEYYLLIRTELGFTEKIEYGPATPDIDILPFNVNLNYSRFEFNQYKIEKTIDRFLNDPKRGITQAEVVDIESVRDLIVNPVNRAFPAKERLFEDEGNTNNS